MMALLMRLFRQVILWIVIRTIFLHLKTTEPEPSMKALINAILLIRKHPLLHGHLRMGIPI